MYPIWEVPYISAGMILAFIATFHILPSHLTIGAMWFNIYIETKAYRENKPELLEFIKKYSLFLLVFSYILGSLSGIGIWFAVTSAGPRAISGLIHNYVWGWATEWVFFIIEVTGIFLYYYTLNKVDRKTHLNIGWIFTVSSWITMIVIVGILTFMLTPGKWVATGNFFDGFFNQSYWYQLLIRTAFMFSIGAVFAITVATKISNSEVKRFVMKTSAKWGISSIILSCIIAFLYIRVLPDSAKELLKTIVHGHLKMSILISLSGMTLYFIYVWMRPDTIKLIPAIIAIFVLFGSIWSGERIREIIRKPYVISQYMYSNQIIGHNIPAKGVVSEDSVLNQKGILKTIPFIPEGLREVTENNLLQAGKILALIECSSCHTLQPKGLRPLSEMAKRMSLNDISAAEDFLDIIGNWQYMPPFYGTEEEAHALAAYLVSLTKEGVK